MNEQEQVRRFQAELEAMIARYQREFDITVASAIGVLEVVKLDLWHNQLNDE